MTLKPNLAAYARVSYFRELTGDLGGALQAMRLAVSSAAGGESLAYVQTLTGGLELDRGNPAAAEGAYRAALAASPGYSPALAGLARVDAARGDLGAAIDGYREVVERLPLPEYAIALAEAELAAGRDAAAARDLALVEVEARLLQDSGVNVDVELALFEADHGDPARAVELARAAWRAAPGVRSADALSWALRSAGEGRAALASSREAMRLGSADPTFLYHAGMIAADAGRTGLARRLPDRGGRAHPRLQPLPRAARAGGARGSRMSRPARLLSLLAVAAAFLLLPAGAAAHPLGNFSTNQLLELRFDRAGGELHYVLDQAEIPSFQQLQRYDSDGDGRLAGAETGPLVDELLATAAEGIAVTADGRPVDLGPARAVELSFPAGQAGLRLTRLEADFRLPATVDGAEVEVANDAYASRVGWRAIRAVPGEGTAVDSSVPADDPTGGLRDYPADLLESPRDQSSARFDGHARERDRERAGIRPGCDLGLGWRRRLRRHPDRLRRPRAPDPGPARDRVRLGRPARALARAREGDGRRLPRRVARAPAPRAGPRLDRDRDPHRLGLRPRPGDAARLRVRAPRGHLPVARGRLRAARGRGRADRDAFALSPLARRARGRRRAARPRPRHDHGHDHPHDAPIRGRELLGLGVSGGLVPCPSALVVLIAAISQHRVGLGMGLIFAFSLGLAATVSAVGLVTIWGGRLIGRLRPEQRLFGGRLTGALPALSASAIVLVGVLITYRAMPALV